MSIPNKYDDRVYHGDLQSFLCLSIVQYPSPQIKQNHAVSEAASLSSSGKVGIYLFYWLG
jgi:hypothetical protein